MDRRIAEWVLKIGGKVSIGEDFGDDWVSEVNDLPAEHFRLNTVDLRNNSQVSDNDLTRFENLNHPFALFLSDTSITDRGLQYIESLTELRLLWLNGTKITDAD